MTLQKLISLDEELEPETVKAFFPNYSSDDVSKILAMRVALKTDVAYNDMDVFENLVYVLNDIKPDVLKTEGCTPYMIWNAISILKKIRPDFKLSYEVLMYIKFIFNDNGYYFYPENIGFDNKLIDDIKNNLNKDTLSEDNFIDIQTSKYIHLIKV